MREVKRIFARKSADQRVEKVLQAAGLEYTIDEDGDFVLFFKFADGRTQIGWIRSKTTYLGPIEIRYVFSLGYCSKRPIPPEIANRLLEENGQVKVGAWHIRKIGTHHVAIFEAQIPAEADQTTLVGALQAVTATADEMGKELTQRDEF